MGYVAMAGDMFDCPNSGRRQRSVVVFRSILQCAGQDLPAQNHTARVVCTVLEKLTQIHRTESMTLKPVLERAEEGCCAKKE